MHEVTYHEQPTASGRLLGTCTPSLGPRKGCVTTWSFLSGVRCMLGIGVHGMVDQIAH